MYIGFGLGLAQDHVLRHCGMAMEHYCKVFRELEVAGSIHGDLSPFICLIYWKTTKIEVINNRV